MYCVIQVMECKKSDTRGYPKKISVSSYESEVMGKIQKNYDLSYSEERFERPIKRSYKISVQESYRENGKVKKRGSSICTIKYYDLAEGYFNLTDWAESAIIKAAEKFNVTVDKIYEVIETKLDKLEAEVQAEFHKTEEYLTYEKNKEIVTSYRSKKKRFNEKYGTADDPNPYDRCRDFEGNITDNDECAKILLAHAKREEQRIKEEQEEYEKGFKDWEKTYKDYQRSYQEQQSSNHKDYDESEKKMLRKFYMALSQMFHPDSNPNADTTKEMQFLNRLREDWGV